MLEALKQRVCTENKRLSSVGLVISTWGNVSARCEETGFIVMKPSGVSYEAMTPDDMVVLSLEGDILEGELKPSSDTETHLVLYNACEAIQSVVHTHSTYATIWAQMGKEIPPLGTTHSDDFYGAIPCSRSLREEEIWEEYEKNTGKVILETLGQQKGKDLSQKQIEETPAVLVKHHGPFVWGASPEKAILKAIILEEVAKMAWHCQWVGATSPLPTALMDKHFFRKHGKYAYYGQ